MPELPYFCDALKSSNSQQKNDFNHNEHKSDARWLIVWAGLSIFIPIALLYFYSCRPDAWAYAGIELKQIQGNTNLDQMLLALKDPESSTNSTGNLLNNSDHLAGDTSTTIGIALTNASTNGRAETSIPIFGQRKAFSLPAYQLSLLNDTTKHRILLIGDSESGGLRYPLNDYCIANGHKLILSLEWYSATTFNFGRSDTVDKIIARFNPTYIFLVFGLNELYARDLKARKIAANQVARKLRGVPYAWIGPANWEEDKGINKVYSSSADTGAFFLTKKLALPRATDGRHPDVKGYRIWMDSIAGWLQTSAKYKILMKPPRKRGRPFRSAIITLNAAKYRGY